MREVACPQCQRMFVQRVRRWWVLEHALSLFYIYPFRCQLCGHRFRAQQWGVQYVRHPLDRRQYARMATSYPARFSGVSGEGEGVVLELSLGGCGLRTTAPLAEGTLFQMQVQPSPEAPVILVDAAVVRSARAGFAGVEFLRLTAQAQERLGQCMHDLLASRRATPEQAWSVSA